MESTQEGASTDDQSSDNTNITSAKQQTTPETKTNILCQTKSVSTIHTPANNTVNTKQPVAMLHFKELEAQLKAERAAQQTDAIAAQHSFEKGPKMIPIEMIAPIQHSNSDEDSLDDAKNYRLPIGIRKMNEKARKFYCVVRCVVYLVSSLCFVLCACDYILNTFCLVAYVSKVPRNWQDNRN